MASNEKETLIYIPVEQAIDPNNVIFKCVGIETNEPIIQIGSNLFKCEYEDALGTLLFLEKDEKTNQYKYACKANKVLRTKPTVVKKKVDKNDTSEGNIEQAVVNIPDSYEKALELIESTEKLNI